MRKALSAKKRFYVLARDHYRCRYCGAGAETAKLHVDHVVPVAAGGTDDTWNLTAACQDCNLGKRAQMPSDLVVREIREVEAARRAEETYACMRCSKPTTDDECESCTIISVTSWMAGFEAGEASRRRLQ
jgi:DNA-directed RNA polymerase subunit RPC12/RpoP